jgi:hypothetical protein
MVFPKAQLQLYCFSLNDWLCVTQKACGSLWIIDYLLNNLKGEPLKTDPVGKPSDPQGWEKLETIVQNS